MPSAQQVAVPVLDAATATPETVTAAALAGQVALRVTPDSVQQVFSLLKSHRYELQLLTGGIDASTVIELLNAGARVVFLHSEDQVSAVNAICEVPSARLGLVVESNAEGLFEPAKVVTAAKLVGHIQLRAAQFSIDSIRACASAVDLNKTILSFDGVASADHVQQLDSAGLESLIDTSKLDLSQALLAVLTTDRADGLFTTMVVDERGTALGVCYSNGESLREAVKQQVGVYWSRKRGLWVKGATSGATQQLHRISVDCDRDLLVFHVTQHAEGFCHRGTYTCIGPQQGLDSLLATLNERKVSAPPGSYSKRLYDDPELLKSKLIEEAIELSQASDKDHVAAEAADVMFFTLVACAKAGVSLTDVERHLNHRHYKVKRRPGDAKPAFIEAHMNGHAGKGTESAAAAAPSSHSLAPPAEPSTPAPSSVLRRITVNDIPPLHRDPVDPQARSIAENIMRDVRENGEAALRRHAEKLGDIAPGQPLVLDKAALKAAFHNLPAEQQQTLQRTADRIRAFAHAQLATVEEKMEVEVPGGMAGQSVAPVEVAGCYAPGGRYPLPSSVLMGAITARVAGVGTVWVASPRPHPSVLAAAHLAGADGLLAAGGAQAIAAFAYGAGPIPVCDAIVGPGNKFVTAAKSLVAGAVAIDMLAGPSECLLVADDSAHPAVVAADLLAQSEHDVMARAILVTPSAALVQAVEVEVQKQLAVLPTAETARVAIERNSFAVITKDLGEAVEVADRLAPEHLEVHVKEASALAGRFTHYGALFVGHDSAEVLGDYGAGPNHTLPTGGTARSFGGLSVHTFLRHRTWLRVDDRQAAKEMVQDAVDLALIEGLHGHSRAAALRLPSAEDTVTAI